MEKIKAPDYYCGTCFICGKPAEIFHGKLQGVMCYKSGYKKPILINAGFCSKHALSVFDITGETILGDYNHDKMGPVITEKELEEYYNYAMIQEDVKSLREGFLRNQKKQQYKIQNRKQR